MALLNKDTLQYWARHLSVTEINIIKDISDTFKRLVWEQKDFWLWMFEYNVTANEGRLMEIRKKDVIELSSLYLDLHNTWSLDYIVSYGYEKLMLTKVVGRLDAGELLYINEHIITASKIGFTHVVDILIQLCYKYERKIKWYDIMITAIQHNHIDIVMLLLQYDIEGQLTPSELQTLWNVCLEITAHYGYVDMLNLVLTKGTTNFGTAIEAAISENHLDIVKILLPKCLNDLQSILSTALTSGSLDVVKYLVSVQTEPINWNHSLLNVSKNICLDKVQYVIDNLLKAPELISTSDVIEATYEAISSRDVEMAELIITSFTSVCKNIDWNFINGYMNKILSK